MSTDWHNTLRHALYVLGGVVALFLVLQHFAPAPEPVHAPVAVFTPSPVEHEAQAAIDALKAVAQAKSGVSVLQQPAVAVIKDTGMVKGLSDAQIAQILSALKPKTVEKVAVGTKVVGPSPAPTPSDALMQQIYAADYSATSNALKDTTIKTDVTISREEIPASRIGSFISASGSGLSFGIVRHKQYELDLAGVERGAHIAPAASVQYLIPHTSLGVGPSVVYDHGARWGIAATVHF
jgi:hypothetical protein